jgi:hypothetical protein
MLLLFTGILIVLVLFGSQLQVRTAFAVPGLTRGNPVTLGANTCIGSGCHVSTGSPGTAVVTGFPSGMTYTPGVTQHLSVMVNDTSGSKRGFELTARLASALQAGTFSTPGANTNLGTNGVQVVQGLQSGTTAFTFDWTPPATAAGTVTFYLTGWAGGFPSGNSYTAMFPLTAAAASATPDFSLSASPTSLSVTQGLSGTSTITVTPSNGFNGAVTFSASGVPSGVTASFSSSTLTLAASSTATTGPSTVTITGTSGALTHTTTVSLTVSAAGTSTSTLTATPSSLRFNYQMGGRLPSSQTLAISSTGGSTSYTATETDPWLSINPTSGSGTPGSIRASVNPAGMAVGSYGAQINITAQNGKTITVTVALIITAGSGGGGTTGSMFAQPSMSDSQTGTVAAAWVDNLGASPLSTTDPRNRGLVLAKDASAPANAWAGAVIQNVTGMSLTELSFDFRASIPCSADSPHFLVTTMDGKTHTVGGCKSSPAAPTSSAPMGWTRLRFDLSQGPQAITSPVQSISLVLNTGSTSTGSIAVIDNIEVNGVPVGKGATSRSRDD